MFASAAQLRRLDATRAWLLPTLVGAALRVPIFCVADDQFGDAPARLELVQHFTAHPHLMWSFRDVYQYGPLPLLLGGVASLAGLGDVYGPRAIALIFGILAIALAARVATRLSGPLAGLAAGCAIALGPLAIQTSTTFASESIYLAFALACLDRTLARDVVGTALAAFCASTTRYDTWFWLPLVCLWWLWKSDAETRPRAILACALMTLGPASILLANGLDGLSPLAPLQYISQEHVELAATGEAAHGKWLFRIATVAYWPAATVAVLTPGFAVSALRALPARLRARDAALLPTALGAIPPLLYSARSVLFGTFWPMTRFAVGPAAMLLVATPKTSPRALFACVVLAIGFDAALYFIADPSDDVRGTALAICPVSRLPDDLRAGAQVLTDARGPTYLEEGPYYEDMLITAHAHVDRWQFRNLPDGTVPIHVITIRYGKLDGVMKQSGVAFGAHYRLVGAQGRVSWWDRDAIAGATAIEKRATPIE